MDDVTITEESGCVCHRQALKQKKWQTFKPATS